MNGDALFWIMIGGLLASCLTATAARAKFDISPILEPDLRVAFQPDRVPVVESLSQTIEPARSV